MEILKNYWPNAFKPTNVKEMGLTLLLYFVPAAICDLVLGLVFGLLAKIPLIGIVFSLVGWLVGSVIGLYALVGIVVTLLVYFKVLK